MSLDMEPFFVCKGESMKRFLEAAKGGEAEAPSSIMPHVADSPALELSAEDRLVILLASAAQEGGRLSPSAWKKASDAFAEK